MSKFRKRPVVIEAIQWTAPGRDNHAVALAFDAWMAANRGKNKCPRYRGDKLFISTLEGVHEASPGDWIIKGVKGELYPCKPDIFAATYDAVNETDIPT